MTRNPHRRPDGSMPDVDPNPTALNPEIAEYFLARRLRLKVVATTRTRSGDTLDWIPVGSQVAEGSIAAPPPPRTEEHPFRPDERTKHIRFELLEPGAERGPAGTVPVFRKRIEALHETTSLSYYLSKRGAARLNPKRRHAGPIDPNPTFYHCMSGQMIDCGGCGTWLNVWQPYVAGSNDHSTWQLGMSNYDNPQQQTLEAGWTCDQSLNGDWSPHLFTYYTTNNYTADGDNIGGYNSDVDGWVQVSGSIYPGIGLSPASTYGGAQYGLGIWYMLYNNNWWFWVQNNANGDGEWIGYYPSWLFFGQPGDSEFSTLGALAEWVGFWGEVGTASSDPQSDATQMGSGARAEAGWTKAAFQKNLFVQIGVNGPFWQQAGTATADDSQKYDIELFAESGSNWGSYFYAGG